MVVLGKILYTIIAILAVFFTCMFITSVIKAIINPDIEIDKDGKAYDAHANSRVIYMLLLSIFWGLVIAL
jgi:hypothetical protein